MMPDSMFLGLAYAFIIMAVMAILFKKGKAGRRAAAAVAIVTLIVAGLLLGGVPDPVAQYMQVFRGLSLGNVPIVPLFGLSLLTIMALVTGRLFCSHACPMGAAQELMSRTSDLRIDIDRFRPRLVRAVVTAIVAALALATPFVLGANPFRFFGLQFTLAATTVFVAVLIVSAVVYRPWCRLLCPFGAISELASRRSFLRLRRQPSCNDCGRCVRACPTKQPVPDGNMSECYLCGRCTDVCRKGSLIYGPK